jgi:hypothetical protein
MLNDTVPVRTATAGKCTMNGKTSFFQEQLQERPEPGSKRLVSRHVYERFFDGATSCQEYNLTMVKTVGKVFSDTTTLT